MSQLGGPSRVPARRPARGVLLAACTGLVCLSLLASPGDVPRSQAAPTGPSPSARPVPGRAADPGRAVGPGKAAGSPRAAGAPAGPAGGIVVSAAAPADTPPGTVTLAFGGDVHFEGHVAALLKRPDVALAALRPHLAAADVAMVNLETSITGRGTPQPKEYRFRTSPTALRALAAAGVDVVTMANNHAVDFGGVGLADTLAARRGAPVRVVGIGANAAEAYAPAVVTAHGRRIAVLAASQLLDWTLQHFGATATRPGIAGARPAEPLLRAVRAARRQADVVVVYLHWGTERMACPEPAQRELARQLAAAGADVVVGAHPHVTQGAGWLGRTFVAYSLGNFVWYSRGSDASTSTGVLTLTLTGRRVTASRWTPLRIGSDGVPRPPAAATGAAMARSWQQSRGCTGLSAAPAPR